MSRYQELIAILENYKKKGIKTFGDYVNVQVAN